MKIKIGTALILLTITTVFSCEENSETTCDTYYVSYLDQETTDTRLVYKYNSSGDLVKISSESKSGKEIAQFNQFFNYTGSQLTGIESPNSQYKFVYDIQNRCHYMLRYSES